MHAHTNLYRHVSCIAFFFVFFLVHALDPIYTTCVAAIGTFLVCLWLDIEAYSRHVFPYLSTPLRRHLAFPAYLMALHQ